jgi:hypothetical protein
MGMFDSLKAALKTPATSTLPPPPARDLEWLSLNDEVAVVGTSNYQKALKRVSGWTKSEGPVERYHNAIVELEPTNPYDKNAIKVTVNGLLIGYIAKSDHRLMLGKVRKAGGAALAEVVLIGGVDGKLLGARLRS